MYNFSGIVYRIWGVCGVIFIVGIICIFLDKILKKGFSFRKCKFGIIVILFAICMSIVYISRIAFPKVSSYTGEFVEQHRNSRVAPPIPVTQEYVFWNGVGKKQVYYLDIFSKEKIFNADFEKGQKYTIYYDEFTNVIVYVEIVE